MKKILKIFFWIIFVLTVLFLIWSNLVFLKILYPSSEFYLYLAIGVLSIISFIGGILLLKKYLKTKRKLYLFLGIVLTFIIPGLYYYFSSKLMEPVIMCYMPAMSLTSATSVKLSTYRKDLIKKFGNNLPKDVISKINSPEK